MGLLIGIVALLLAGWIVWRSVDRETLRRSRVLGCALLIAVLLCLLALIAVVSATQ